MQDSHSFTSGGRTWTIELTIGSAEKVHRRCGVNLFDVKNADTFAALQDPFVLTSCVALLCGCDADEEIEAFKAGLDAESLEGLSAAWEAALVDFFRRANPKLAALLTASIQDASRVMSATVDFATQRMNDAGRDDEIKAAVERMLTFGLSAGSEPELPESTLAD